ncbi:uncharacterized protein Z518_03188 [Rhinocladiella mackenziei CBS 650.93]|uniref:Rhinocladiella mackenziei CBS 650.93 unplaced genomic scaffold supercont1.2, whole genome shotgun sequence n=1 Tax=Rhinocladiella mackenziei CBS 650.93 TaxID=1442369 RepID=A0A0D2G235_9EURO|nr:uncharacterized protein Z518_03188 [Rhinocladiella mackenziei CBS 650.93]KIX08532.1 hypothetical protein Z518_03188 [Rhinocladiella mackenziei CBS 650.93]
MNRKQRRAKASSNQPTSQTADDIPLARPDTTSPSRKTKAKTLLEIAAERQAQLNPNRSVNKTISKPENIVQLKIGEDGQIINDPASASSSLLNPDSENGSEPETPWLDTLLLASTLSAVHFTLEVLTVHQYAQELHFPPIIAHTTFVAFPTLTVVIALFHGVLLPISLPQAVRLWVLALRQVVYVLTANIAGCYLIQLTNDKGYYAVMKNAPGIGTIWVWAVLELGLTGALAGVVGPGIFAWWFGYGIW